MNKLYQQSGSQKLLAEQKSYEVAIYLLRKAVQNNLEVLRRTGSLVETPIPLFPCCYNGIVFTSLRYQVNNKEV